MHWNTLIKSPTKEIYQKNFTKLTVAWNPPTADYLLKNWIPLKSKFVACHINHILHFDTRVSSRVEGLHSYIKRFFSSSAASLSAVVKQIDQALKIQLHERFVQATETSFKRLVGLPPSLDHLHGIISHHALKTCAAYSLSQSKSSSTCPHDCLFTSYMGMPCEHQVKKAEEDNLVFKAEDFHPQWYVVQGIQVSPFSSKLSLL